MNAVFTFFESTGKMGLFCGQVFSSLFRPPLFWRETLRSMYTIGFQCLLPVLAIVVPTGMVTTLQGLHVFELFGAQRLLSSLLAEAVFRELSPTLVSIMVAAQAGSSVSGEIGTMRVKEEIDAMEVMAVDPFQYVIIPRLIALAVMVPLINAIACFGGILGGYAVAIGLKGLNSGVFLANLFSFAKLSHIWGGMFKACVFGLIVGIISCYKGFHVTGGALGVGLAANTTVVHSILLIVCVNYFLTSALVTLLG
ncbi:MAG: ABC transporter permease [Candidatus Sericytochromatia bacterium]|jgi:phospholipid/cholesterol/gamma-HCH transport system permease protein|nr:ABC transporter permease [Candidatus Sericytochromatia bacterium]